MFWYSDTPVYIYGAGLKGRLISNLLKGLGCSVYGFLDRATQNICENQNVFYPDQLSIKQRENSIIICSVSNVFDHRKIVSDLAQLGYIYILYKEVGGKADENKQIIDIIWDAIEDSEQYSSTEIRNIITGRNILPYINRKEKEDGEMVVRENGGCIDVKISAIFLYTFPKELYISFHKRQDWLRIPYERNVYYYLYCANLFRMFENGAVSEQEWEEVFRVYRRYFANADVYDEGVLDIKFKQHVEQRYRIYSEMNRLFHSNREFFEENPLYVKWNENNQSLYVRDGNNRLAFLMVKGIHNVMCRMTKKDYDRWKSKQESQSKYLPTEEEKTAARMALRWIGKLDLLEKVNNVLFLSHNSLLSDALCKMGVNVVSCEDMVSLEAVDLVWINLSYVYSQGKKERMVRLLNKCSKLFILEGIKEGTRQFIERIHGELAAPVCVYWNKDEGVELTLVRRGNYGKELSD